MEYRPLGHTGVSVSQLCLGAMMFGAYGNPDHDDSIARRQRFAEAYDVTSPANAAKLDAASRRR